MLYRGVLWEPDGTAVLLDDLLSPEDSQWRTVYARAISGDFVATMATTAASGALERPVLLVPVPEPAAVNAALAVAGALLLRRRRRSARPPRLSCPPCVLAVRP